MHNFPAPLPMKIGEGEDRPRLPRLSQAFSAFCEEILSRCAAAPQALRRW
jgi:hypothetical protein